MAGSAEAVARLRLDATGFDKQANASFREFSKQLTSVKDATDAAMRGAEALQKVFVKSLGGTIAIGAANALGDAMRDVGAKIGSAGQLAADAQAGIKGLAQSFEEGAARAEKLNAAAAGVAKTLEELKNSSPVQAAIFKVFGGEQTLSDLQESLRGAADAEAMVGAQRGRDRARNTAGMTPEQVKDFDRQAARQAQLDSAKRLGAPFAATTEQFLREQFAAEDAAAEAAKQKAATENQQREDEKYQQELSKAEQDAAKYEREQREKKAAETDAEQKAYLEKQYAAARRASESDDAATRAYYTFVQQSDTQRARTIEATSEIGAQGLTASRRGNQILENARKRQAERNRLDNFKFAEETVQKEVDRLRTRGSGQSLEDFEKFSGMGDDAARQAVRRRFADEEAKRNDPSMRDQAAEKLDQIRTLLEKNLTDLKTYAHVS